MALLDAVLVPSLDAGRLGRLARLTALVVVLGVLPMAEVSVGCRQVAVALAECKDCRLVP